MYAIVKTGGKQYRVEAGRTLEVDSLPAGEGETVELGDVLMIADNGDVTIGTPIIDGARVLAHVEGHGRAPKIVVFKYKSKVRSRKKSGHRQGFTRLTVEEILRPGEEAKVKAWVPADGNLDTEEEVAEAIVAMGEAAEPVVVAEDVATLKPKTRRTAPAAEKKPAKAVAKKPAKAEPAKRTPRAAAKPKAGKPAAKAKAPAKAKAKTDEKPKAPRRRLPLRRKKETE
jgi:large subunit ribosomal protein L21